MQFCFPIKNAVVFDFVLGEGGTTTQGAAHSHRLAVPGFMNEINDPVAGKLSRFFCVFLLCFLFFFKEHVCHGK